MHHATQHNTTPPTKTKIFAIITLQVKNKPQLLGHTSIVWGAFFQALGHSYSACQRGRSSSRQTGGDWAGPRDYVGRHSDERAGVNTHHTYTHTRTLSHTHTTHRVTRALTHTHTQ